MNTLIANNATYPTQPLNKTANALIKRSFDILFAATVLILLAPVLIFIAILIRIDSKGPVFYRPIRQGKDGREFTCLKFRTMYTELCEDPRKRDLDDGHKSTIKNDPRITRGHRWEASFAREIWMSCHSLSMYCWVR